MESVAVPEAESASNTQAISSEPLKLDQIESQFTHKVGGLNVLICSWNVGNAEPKAEEISKYWINPTDDTDLVAVGVQECAYKAANGEKQDPHFDNIVAQSCGPDFYEVSTHHLWEMRLYVFARKKHQSFILNVEVANEATGIAHILGNKGGLITKFDAYGVSLCFISCHLAAHQGKVKDRNGNCEEICRNARIANKQLDVISQFDHCFFLGDLNYRIDLVGEEGTEEAEQWAKVAKLVEEENWSKLYEGDQLQQNISAGKCMSGFIDTVPQFMPTFKVLREPGTTYKNQRIPAYCDRILHKSMPSSAQDITNTMFRNCPDLTTSDHKPVHGTYAVKLPPPLTLKGPVGPVLVFDEIGAKNLIAADIRTSDPYVLFFTNPTELFASEKTPQTEMVKRSLSPTWKSMRLPVMRTSEADALCRVDLVLSVWDADLGPNPDDPLGNAVIALTDLVPASFIAQGPPGTADVASAKKSEPIAFERKLFLDGKHAKDGCVIYGKAHLEWPSQLDRDSSFKNNEFNCCYQCSIQ
jgi:hypothetical protein